MTREHRPETTFTGPEPCAWTARAAVAALRKGEVTPAELLDAAFARIDQVEPAVNAMPTLCPDRAREAAAALPFDTLLAGLPVSIKDLSAVSGVRTTWGNAALADHVPERSDPIVDRIERSGGIVTGKTNTPEFGAGGSTFNAVFGATRNPWNTARNAGGSSGGAAVSLATGEAWLAQGSDLAGSLRTPAGYCGVVGLRPSPGRCGGGPGIAAFLMEGISGPMARDVADLALFLDAMTGFDPREPISLPAPATPFRNALEAPPGPIRIAFSDDQGGFAPVEPVIRETLAAAMAVAEGAGMQVTETCPDLPVLYDTYTTLRGLHYGTVLAAQPAHVQAEYKETLRRNVEFGLALSAERLFAAQRHRTDLYHRMRLFLQDHDVLALPVTGLPPGPVDEEYPTVVDGHTLPDYLDWLRFSFLATTTGLPALAMPCGFTPDGLPVGLQLIGPPRGEARLLQVALALEQALALPATPIDPMKGADG